MAKRKIHVKIGDKFSYLTVKTPDAYIKGDRYHICVCKCGIVKSVSHGNLVHKKTRSCGCLSKDKPNSRTHGMSKTRVYATWGRMIGRCTNKNLERYKHYGGRGIKVCQRWRSFENFYSDMGDIPSADHSLGRINNDGDYEPNNVEWQTAHQQANNMSTNILIEFNCMVKTLSEWCTHLNLSYTSILQRYNNGTKPPELFSAKHGHYKFITYKNKTLKVTEWMKAANIPISSYYHFIRKGMTPEEVVGKYLRIQHDKL